MSNKVTRPGPNPTSQVLAEALGKQGLRGEFQVSQDHMEKARLKIKRKGQSGRAPCQ